MRPSTKLYIRSLKKNLRMCLRSMAGMAGDFAMLEAKVAALTSRVHGLQADVGSATGGQRLAETQARIARDARDHAYEERDKLKGEIAKLKEDNGALSEEVERLRGINLSLVKYAPHDAVPLYRGPIVGHLALPSCTDAQKGPGGAE